MKFKYSGIIAEDDTWHSLTLVKGEKIIAPKYVEVPGVGKIPQYADTVKGKFAGYNPAKDCDGYFMSSKFQPNNNCYAYGCVIASNSFPQPGRLHGYLLPSGFTGKDVVKGALMDGLEIVGDTIDALERFKPEEPGHYVALLISPPIGDKDKPSDYWPGDYHWVRCDDNIWGHHDDGKRFRSWSQKDGGDQVTDFDFAGEKIRDPARANWIVNQGPTSTGDDLVVAYDFFTYMFVPTGKVNII